MTFAPGDRVWVLSEGRSGEVVGPDFPRDSDEVDDDCGGDLRGGDPIGSPKARRWLRHLYDPYSWDIARVLREMALLEGVQNQHATPKQEPLNKRKADHA